jgi:hypothetical protein
MSLATGQLYHPHSYDQKLFQLGQLLYQLEGIHMAAITQKALGLPSICTLSHQATVQPLTVLAGYPTVEDIKHNFELVFGDSLAREPQVRGAVIMFDELAIETRLRYDLLTNMILGTCCEHCGPFDLTFDSHDEAEVIFEGICSGKIHFASEVWFY